MIKNVAHVEHVAHDEAESVIKETRLPHTDEVRTNLEALFLAGFELGAAFVKKYPQHAQALTEWFEHGEPAEAREAFVNAMEADFVLMLTTCEKQPLLN